MRPDRVEYEENLLNLEPLKGNLLSPFMEWRRVAAIGLVLMDEMAFTLLYFAVLPLFDVHLPLEGYLGVMAFLVVKDIVVIRLVWNVVVKKPEIGKESLLGKTGVALTDLDPYGIIRIENELWNVETLNPVKKGEQVKVLNVNGLFLQVQPANN